MNEVLLKRPSTRASRKAEFLKSVRRFFEEQGEVKLQLGRCDRCGASMSRCEAEFWLLGGKQRWRFQLPYCAVCNPPQSQ